MGRLRSFVGVLVVGALVFAACPLGASAQDPARQARARQLYAEAQALFDSGQYAAAEASFRAAYEQVPNPVVLRAIAAAQERQGNIALAAQTLQQYLREAPNASDRAEVEQRLREFNARGSVVAVSSTPAGAQILVDGEDSGQVTPADLQVTPGEHTIEVRLDGYQPRSQELTAQPGARVRLEVPLQPGEIEPEPEPVDAGATVTDGANSADPSLGVWVTSGIAAAGLVSGTVFGFLALSEQSNFDAMPTHQTADQGELFALIADISFGVAAAAAITAIVLYIVERSSGSAEAQETATSGVRLDLAPWADANGGGMAAQLRF